MEQEREKKTFTRLYRARKVWLHLRGALGIDVARCTVERLMRAQGWVGALRRKRVRTTVPDEAAARAADRVDRRFWAPAPNRLWCADFERHEAFLDLAVVKGHRGQLVAAGW